MTILNSFLLIVNLLIFGRLFMVALSDPENQNAKFYSINETIKLWRSKLQSGDKFIIYPAVKKSSADSFLQFKIHQTESVKFVDLVYPIVTSDVNYELQEKKLQSLIVFFQLKHKEYFDKSNGIKFYFIDIQPEENNHVLFLCAVALTLENFKLNTKINIEVINEQIQEFSNRYVP